MTSTSPNYWQMGDEQLAVAWREIDGANFADDYSGELTEKVNFIEDAILQRIGAPDDASGDDPEWQEKIRAFAVLSLPGTPMRDGKYAPDLEPNVDPA